MQDVFWDISDTIDPFLLLFHSFPCTPSLPLLPLHSFSLPTLPPVKCLLYSEQLFCNRRLITHGFLSVNQKDFQECCPLAPTGALPLYLIGTWAAAGPWPLG